MDSTSPHTPMMSTLLTLPLFQGLTLEQLMALLEKAVPEFNTYRDEPILLNGQSHNRVQLILRGTVSRHYTDPQGRVRLREQLREGEIIEFYSLFGRSTLSTADYRAEGEVSILSFDKHHLFCVFNRFDIVQMNLLNLCCARAQTLQAKLTHLAAGTVAERFYHLVDSLSDTPYGEKELTVSFDSLAELLGCSRRPLGTEIAAWEKAGLVRHSYAQIVIPSLARFRTAF